MRFLWVVLLAVVLPVAAMAQESPRDIQTMIANGQENQALGILSGVVQAHPDSGVAWYLTAEAQDAAGNEPAARDALAKAEQFAPGLPFANQSDVAALRAHVGAARHGGLGWLKLLGGAFVLFVLWRLFFGRRVGRAVYGGGAYYPGAPQGGGYGPGYGPPGGGIGGSLLGGLAAGAGFAAGERIIDDLSGGNRDPGFVDPAPDMDDGLNGSPGWDNSGGQDDNFDSGNGW